MLGGGSDGAHSSHFSRNLQEKYESSPSVQSSGRSRLRGGRRRAVAVTVATHAAPEIPGRAGGEEEHREPPEHEQRDGHR